jgi:hypothetical protein
MRHSPWRVTFTRDEAEASVAWRKANITSRYSYEIVPVQPWMTDNDKARERHDGRSGRHGSGRMEDCADVDCAEAASRLFRDEMNRQFAARDAAAGDAADDRP